MDWNDNVFSVCCASYIKQKMAYRNNKGKIQIIPYNTDCDCVCNVCAYDWFYGEWHIAFKSYI